MTTLIVAEKPNVAKRIAESLGKAEQKKKGRVSYYILKDEDIVVASAVGHLFTLRQARPIDRYPFFDIKWISPNTFDKKMAYIGQYIDILEKLGKDADEVVNACDYDIEGSVIGHNAIVYACKMDPNKAQRMKFSTLTAPELRASYESRENQLNFPMVEAGLTRHELDWYWGINTSKALSSSVKRKSGRYFALSAGRVQTPTLQFINDREKQIIAFVPTPYWNIDIKFKKDENDIKASYPEKILEKEHAESIYKDIKGKNGIVEVVKKTKTKKVPPTPMDLGLLQTEAWGNFKFLPKRTQDVAQTLYEAGLISYPRTSSQKLPKSLGFETILKNIQKNPKYQESAKKVLETPLVPKEGKKDDPAHPAIYPTGSLPETLTRDQEKLYDLIVNRFFAVFMPESIVENISITVAIESHPFVTKGQRIVVEGWMQFYGKYIRSSKGPLPDFVKGESINVLSHDKIKKMTKPPARYNPASAIKEMESLGIGTKATRANIVDTLYQRGYLKGKEIEITEIGQTLVTTLETYCNEIVSVKLTNHFEKEMELILASEKTRADVLDEAKSSLREIFKEFRDHEEEIGSNLITAIKNTNNQKIGTCPKCGGDLKVVVSKTTNKRFVGCANYPKCKTSYPLPQKGYLTFSEEICPECGAPMLKNRRIPRCIDIECGKKEKIKKVEQS